MGRKLTVEIVESIDELKKALQYSRSASSKERLQVIYWLKSGQVTSRSEIGERLGRDPATITRWIKKYKSGGIRELLSVKKAPGKTPMLTLENLERLEEKLSEPKGFKSYGQIQEWLLNELGINMAYKTVYQLVRYKLGAKLKVPRPQSLEQNPLSRESFKKKLPEAVRCLQDLFGNGKAIRYMCQDETRLGLKTIGGRVITAPGIKPIGKNQWKRDNLYLYGVVEPLSGYSFFYEFSNFDGDCFQVFVDLLSKDIGDDLAIVQLDQASCHTTKELDWPENIIPICQPSHCPELNPIERFWEFIKSKLKWDNFKNLNQLRSKLTEILNAISPEEVASITSYTFILEALFSAAL